MRNYDVVIIGASVAGLSTALGLLERGITSLLIDKKREIGLPVQCAEFVPAPFVGVASFVRESAAQVVEAMETRITANGETERSTVSFRGFILDRDKWERRLAARVVALGGQVVLGNRVLSFAPDGSVGTDTGLLKGRVVVAADGPRSIAHELLGIKPRLMPATQRTVVLRKPLNRTLILFDRRIIGGYGWLFPKGELANLGVGGWGSLSEMLDIALDNFSDFVYPDLVGSTGGAIPVSGVPRRLARGGILLVGDAAGFADPITGAGIANAYESGSYAAETISAFLRGNESDLSLYDNRIDFLRRSLARSAAKREAMEMKWENSDFISLIKRSWIGFR